MEVDSDITDGVRTEEVRQPKKIQYQEGVSADGIDVVEP